MHSRASAGGNCAELAGYGIFLGISAGVCYAVMVRRRSSRRLWAACAICPSLLITLIVPFFPSPCRAQYIPQIVESARVRGAMALSYVSLSLHVVVGVAAAVQKARAHHNLPL